MYHDHKLFSFLALDPKMYIKKFKRKKKTFLFK